MEVYFRLECRQQHSVKSKFEEYNRCQVNASGRNKKVVSEAYQTRNIVSERQSQFKWWNCMPINGPSRLTNLILSVLCRQP